MTKQRGKIGKYSKISHQKKYELLKLAKFNGMNLKEVIFIIFRHLRNYRSITLQQKQYYFNTRKAKTKIHQNISIKKPYNQLSKDLL